MDMVNETAAVFSLTWGDIIALLGVLITLVLGIINRVTISRITKQTKYIDTITIERIKWLEKLRNDISRFSGLTSFWVKSLRCLDDTQSHEVLKELDVLRVMIKLRLNPTGEFDKQIMQALDRIPLLTGKNDLTEMDGELEKLTRLSQGLLKEEWQRVKKESRKGVEVPVIKNSIEA